MPDPAWTVSYSMNQSPEANGFTRLLDGSPIVTEVTGGSPSQRRLEIDSTNGSAVFVLNSSPSLDNIVGATAEVVCRSGTPGDAGFELTFLDYAVGVNVFSNRVTVDIPSDTQGESLFLNLPTANNSTSDVTLRMLFVGGTFSLYRNGVFVVSQPASRAAKAATRFLFWGEGGGTQLFRAMRFFTQGAVVPG